MVIPLDTEQRDALAISTDAYLLLQCIWLCRTAERDAIEKAMGWERSKIGKVMNEVESSGLFSEPTGEFSDDWMSLFNPLENVELDARKTLTGAIIAHLNRTTGRMFRDGRNFQKSIQRLQRALPAEKVQLESFCAIIDWAWLEWGEQYKKFIQPQLFDCTPEKYLERYEKAAEYWRTKAKKQG